VDKSGFAGRPQIPMPCGFPATGPEPAAFAGRYR
jgi:hypothetical protein